MKNDGIISIFHGNFGLSNRLLYFGLNNSKMDILEHYGHFLQSPHPFFIHRSNQSVESLKQSDWLKHYGGNELIAILPPNPNSSSSSVYPSIFLQCSTFTAPLQQKQYQKIYSFKNETSQICFVLVTTTTASRRTQWRRRRIPFADFHSEHL